MIYCLLQLALIEDSIHFKEDLPRTNKKGDMLIYIDFDIGDLREG